MAVRYAALCACRKVRYVTLAHKRKQKFFYFGCSLVRRFYCKKSKQKQQNYFRERDGRTDRRTDGQTDRVRRNMRPLLKEEGRIIMNGDNSTSPMST